MQKEIKIKDRVINELKMDARGTKLRELTVERTAYETECKRLRTMLENAVGGLKMNEIGDIRQYAE
jgi:hypothetical protein